MISSTSSSLVQASLHFASTVGGLEAWVPGVAGAGEAAVNDVILEASSQRSLTNRRFLL